MPSTTASFFVGIAHKLFRHGSIDSSTKANKKTQTMSQKGKRRSDAPATGKQHPIVELNLGTPGEEDGPTRPRIFVHRPTPPATPLLLATATGARINKASGKVTPKAEKKNKKKKHKRGFWRFLFRFRHSHDRRSNEPQAPKSPADAAAEPVAQVFLHPSAAWSHPASQRGQKLEDGAAPEADQPAPDAVVDRSEVFPRPPAPAAARTPVAISISSASVPMVLFSAEKFELPEDFSTVSTLAARRAKKNLLGSSEGCCGAHALGCA
ncbi:hypothetical protein M426DRAFT_18597 [Hypoxylon sp. CI-4A]|nr:hypothetical protein M426DRAFT_18597 [Hypoxylon sp. CI-4A]